jgi:prepilin-type N-terminal cleavage/methylation domain-containing protein
LLEKGELLAMKKKMNFGKHDGFSLLEMLIVVSIGLVLAGVSFVAMLPMLNRTHIDTGYDTVLGVLRSTRHLSITQGHEYLVTFANPGGGNPSTITVQYQPPPPVGSLIYPALQTVNTYTLPTDISFAVQAGFPAGVPDGFGTGALAIDFGYTLVGGTGGSATIVFMPDGSARDGTSPSNGGNYSSGVVYLTRPTGVIYDSRAITVWGATGRIRGWRLSQIGGGNKWVQQ